MHTVQSGQGAPTPWLLDLGFNAEALKPIAPLMLAYLDILFEPFLSRGRYNLKTWNRKARTQELLGDKRWLFMQASPAQLLGTMRVMHGLFNAAEHMGVGLYLERLMSAYTEHHRQDLRTLQAQHPPLSNEVDKISTLIMVNVEENGRQKVRVSLQRSAIDDLESFMDEDVCEVLRAKGISIKDICTQARLKGYPPMDLFTEHVGDKKIQVSLE